MAFSLIFLGHQSEKPRPISLSRVKYLLRAAKSRGCRIDKARNWRYLADCNAVIEVK